MGKAVHGKLEFEPSDQPGERAILTFRANGHINRMALSQEACERLAVALTVIVGPSRVIGLIADAAKGASNAN